MTAMIVPMLRQHQPERLRQIRHLLRRQIPRVQPAQQQIQFRRLFQFLDREHRGFQRVAGDHRAVIGEQHGGVFSGQPLDGVGHRRIAGTIIGHERGLAAFHQVIGRHRRQRGARDRSPAASTAPPNGSSADAPRRAPRRGSGRARCAAALPWSGRRRRPAGRRRPSRDIRAGSSEPSEALVGVTSQPPSSSFTLILPEEPGVSPRSNSERPRRQISSRILVSLMAHTLFSRLVSRFGSAAKP